uniref:Putative capsid protein n=1 Tax=viral metagenome TaxID=1070528 RepID=A0A6M3XF56_9ZZZZ
MKELNVLRKRKHGLIVAVRKFDEERTRDGAVMSGEDQEEYNRMMADIRAMELEIKREEELQELEMRNAPATAAANEPGRPFPTLGDQLMAVRDFYTGRRQDARLFQVRAATGLNEGVPSEGGFLVQTDFVSDLLKDTYNTNEIPGRCRRIPISGPSNAFSMNVIDETSRATGSRWGGVQVYHEAEAASMSGLGSKPKFSKIEMKLEKIMGLCYATDENLQDAAQLGAIIAEAFPEEMGFVLSDDVIRGDGAGKALGILNSPVLVTITKETGQAADTLVTENILKMWKSRRGRNLVWLYNQELEDQLNTLTLAIGTGGVEMKMFQEPQGNSPYGTIKGRPAIPVEVCSGPGDVGDIILADLSQYLIIDKGGIQTAESIHVEFLTAQTVFRFTYRVNGQPLRKGKVTPYKRTSSDFYVSPFVTLGAR